MSNTSNTVGNAAQGEHTTDTSAQGAHSTSHGDQSSSQPSPEELKRLNAELLRDNAKYRKKIRDDEQKAQEAEQQRLQEQGEYKQLAERHEARVRELEPIAERFAALSEQVAAQIKAQIKEWPSEVKAFDPGEEAPIEQRLAWVKKGEALVSKLQEQARTTQPGNAPNPRPTNNAEQNRTQQLMDKMRASGRYSL